MLSLYQQIMFVFNGGRKMFEANGKIYTLEEVKDYYRKHSFLIYNDKEFYEWLETQTIFKKVSQ